MNRRITLRDLLSNLVPVQFSGEDLDPKTRKIEPSGSKIAILSSTDGKRSKQPDIFERVY